MRKDNEDASLLAKTIKNLHLENDSLTRIATAQINKSKIYKNDAEFYYEKFKVIQGNFDKIEKQIDETNQKSNSEIERVAQFDSSRSVDYINSRGDTTINLIAVSLAKSDSVKAINGQLVFLVTEKDSALKNVNSAFLQLDTAFQLQKIVINNLQQRDSNWLEIAKLQKKIQKKEKLKAFFRNLGIGIGIGAAAASAIFLAVH